MFNPKVEKAFLQYKREYPNDDYKPRGVRCWRDYNCFWVVLNSDGEPFPLKYIFSLIEKNHTPDFKTGDAKKALERWGYKCKNLFSAL